MAAGSCPWPARAHPCSVMGTVPRPPSNPRAGGDSRWEVRPPALDPLPCVGPIILSRCRKSGKMQEKMPGSPPPKSRLLDPDDAGPHFFSNTRTLGSCILSTYLVTYFTKSRLAPRSSPVTWASAFNVCRTHFWGHKCKAFPAPGDGASLSPGTPPCPAPGSCSLSPASQGCALQECAASSFLHLRLVSPSGHIPRSAAQRQGRRPRLTARLSGASLPGCAGAAPQLDPPTARVGLG